MHMILYMQKRGKHVDEMKNLFDVILTGRMNLASCQTVLQFQGSYFCLNDKRWFNWSEQGRCCNKINYSLISCYCS